MTTREKIAHLYRRLSFGPTMAELDEGEKRGLQKTIEHLVDYDKVPDGPTVHPYEFVWIHGEEAQVGSWRFRPYWAYQMVRTKRPLKEKLTLFWHSHFAVSDGKVDHASMMLEYLEKIRANANGKFGDLLKEISKDPAMMKYLDVERMFRGTPNENFAREVLELFTLGIGNYTEVDIREVSRALTGWGYMDFWWEMAKTNDDRIKRGLRSGHGFSSFVEIPAIRDDRPKTILGKTKDFTGDDVLLMLAEHPQTARFIAEKMWAFFGSETPAPKAIDRIAKAFLRSKGDIKSCLYALVDCPEFWSESVVRSHTKSPADFVIGLARQQGIGEALDELRDKNATPETRIPQKIVDESGFFVYRMDRMGLRLLFPVDVSGWKWGKAWANPSAMAERFVHHGSWYWQDQNPGPGATRPLEIIKSKQPKDTQDLARLTCELFDVQLSGETFAFVVKVFADREGLKVLEDKHRWVDALYHTVRILVAAPEMHVM